MFFFKLHQKSSEQWQFNMLTHRFVFLRSQHQSIKRETQEAKCSVHVKKNSFERNSFFFFLTRSCYLSQGALTHGDRRATESQDLSRYNFDNKVLFLLIIVLLGILFTSPPPVVSRDYSFQSNHDWFVVWKNSLRKSNFCVSPTL